MCAPLTSMNCRLLAAAALLAMQLACGGDSAVTPGFDEPVDVPVAPRTDEQTIEALTPASLVGTAGGFSPAPPAIRVVSAATGKPLANIRVQFVALGSPSSAVETSHVVTDTLGIASPGRWWFGSRSGTVQVAVALNGSAKLSGFAFVAVVSPDAPALLRALGDPDPAAFAGGTIPAISLAVEDRFSNRVPQVEVTFDVIDGDGEIAARTAISGTSGVATATNWRLALQPGTNRVRAAAGGLEIVFRAEGLDSARLEWYELDAIRTNAGVFPADDLGLSARVGLTPFDRCLCKKQRGYFAGSLGTGSYELNDAQLSRTTMWDRASIEGDLLLATRFDYYYGNETWVYRRINGSGE